MIGTSRVIVAAAVCAGTLAVGCSKSSTGPSDPFAGSWTVTIGNFVLHATPPDSGPMAPFTLTIAKGGQGYTAAFPTITWSVVYGGVPLQVQFPGQSAGQGSLTFSADTLVLKTDASQVYSGCSFYFNAAFTGANAVQGSAWVTCPTQGGDVASGPLTAIRQ